MKDGFRKLENYVDVSHDEAINALVKSIEETEKEIEDLKNAVNDNKIVLKTLIGDQDGMYTKDYKISYKYNTSASIDMNRLRIENIDLYATIMKEYMQITTKRPFVLKRR
jgi:predicted phage-related endonuclease